MPASSNARATNGEEELVVVDEPVDLAVATTSSARISPQREKGLVSR
jgi:hypothetical protein